jgi:hypothetical protein
MTTDSPGQPPAIEGERVARAGARWTREEEEQLVVEVRAGTDLAEIAERHGRTRGGIKSRLVRMMPDGEDVSDSEQLAWITARLRGDPGFDWRAQFERVSDDSMEASEAARSVPRAGHVTGEDGTPDGGLVRAVAALGLPQADRALAAQVIARATGARLHERDVGRGAGEAV